MTASIAFPTRPLVGERAHSLWLSCVLASGVGLRAALGARGTGGALALAAVLLAGLLVSAWAAPVAKPRPRVAPLLWGMGGAAVLVGGPLLFSAGPLHVGTLHATTLHATTRGPFAAWAAAVTVVVVAEEAFLRGALWRACAAWAGGAGALVVTTVAFAGIHVPVYGWRAVPLDLLVGLVLGALRLGSGSAVAPGVAHLVADWAGWWLV